MSTLLCKIELKTKSYKQLCKAKINIIGHINLSNLLTKEIKINNSFFNLKTDKIQTNKNYLTSNLYKNKINISSKKQYQLSKQEIKLKNNDTLDLNYYSNVLYGYNPFINSNIELLFKIFKNISTVTDIDFDMFLFEIDTKKITNINNVSDIFK